MAARKSTKGKATSKSSAKSKSRATTKSHSSSRTKTATLTAYKRKRDFTLTAEPSGASVSGRNARKLHFVVQKHAASHLHFDFRLELDGVMKSWAVPKGPSYDPSVRRLAMEVEDHPIEYNTFEGTIPQGQYGGGTVMLWDRGTYEAEDGGGEDALRDGYKRGDLKIVLQGKRLLGGWVLVRMRGRGERAQWLLIKHRDEYATTKIDVVELVDTSVATGRSMDEIAKPRGRGRVWNSNRVDSEAAATTKKKSTARKSTSAKRAASAKRSASAKTTTRQKTSAAVSRKKPAAPRRRRSTRSTA